MSANYNSISETMRYFSEMYSYAIDILIAMNKTISTTDDYVNLEVKNQDGIYYTYNIPSVTYLNKKIDDLNRQVKSIVSSDKNVENININNNKLYIEPNIIKNCNIPTEFYTKPNYIFENLLNPLLYVKINVNDSITNNTKRVVLRRVILNNNTFFNKYNNRNDITYNDLIKDLDSNFIEYNIDEEILDLPPIQLKNSGSFDVILKDSEYINEYKEFNIVKKCSLVDLNYIENSNDIAINKILKEGDIVSTPNGKTFYKVLNVNQNVNTAIFGLISGYDNIEVGVDTLFITSELYGDKYFNITIGLDEQQIVFLKSITNIENIINSDWGFGVGFYSNDLNINTTTGKIKFIDYYNNNVKNLSKLFESITTEKILPTIYTEKPNSPILDKDNFKVHILNQHIYETKNSIIANKELLATKREDLEQQKNAITDEILLWDNKIKNMVGGNVNSDYQEAVDNINKLLIRKNEVILEITNLKNQIKSELLDSKNNPIPTPKFVVDGAWEMPVNKTNDRTGEQKPTHFKIKITYLNSNNKPNSETLIEVKNLSGVIEECYVPVFDVISTDFRKIKINDGKVEDDYIKLSDNYRAINQLPYGIPINIMNDEKVMLNVKTCIRTLSGDIESDWSNSVTVDVDKNYATLYKQITTLNDRLEYFYSLDLLTDDIYTLNMNYNILLDKVNSIENMIKTT